MMAQIHSSWSKQGDDQCPLLAETRPSHCIKINVRYWETLASAIDSNLTQWLFILNGNFSNKIDQVLIAFIFQQAQRASSMGKV
jgi:hypothetical protein